MRRIETRQHNPSILGCLTLLSLIAGLSEVSDRRGRDEES